MENVLFKVAYPAEFHAQTAVEAALAIRRTMAPRQDRRRHRLGDNRTHEACLRIIDKSGRCRAGRPRPLHPVHGRGATAVRPAGRRPTTRRGGGRSAHHACGHGYPASRSRRFTRDYHDPDKRSIANAVSVRCSTAAGCRSAVAYPLGTGAGARRVCPCWWRSSAPTWPAVPAEAGRAILGLFLDAKRLSATR